MESDAAGASSAPTFVARQPILDGGERTVAAQYVESLHWATRLTAHA